MNRQSRRIVEAVVTRADPCLELKAHPHMIRHAGGYALANKGHDTRAIQGWLGASVDHIDGGLHGPGAEPIQGFLAGVRPAIIF